jgi:hypothetical protein
MKKRTLLRSIILIVLTLMLIVGGNAKALDQQTVYLPVTFRNYCPNFFDDFSNPASGWDVLENKVALGEYLDGEYRILTKNDNIKFYYAHAPTCDRENYTVEVDARWVGDPGWHYGIFWDRNMDIDDHRYKFSVDTEDLTYRLQHFDGVEWHSPVDWTYSPYINGGIASNHLKITKNGPQIALEVNGFVLVTVTDSSFPSRTYTGIFSAPYDGYPTSDARFDNFSVTQLNGN